MKFILTKFPITEEVISKDFREYLSELRFGKQFPNDRGINVSNDHPFEKILDHGGEVPPSLFPAITIVASNDGEASAMPKSWSTAKLVEGDLNDLDAHEWFVSDDAIADMNTIIAEKGALYGIQHSAKWSDSVSFEIWTENIETKNAIYNLVIAYLTGPKALGLKQGHDITIHSRTIQGQRSGYYNFDFGRTLYGARISLQADYDIIQAVYDGEIATIKDIEAILHAEVL